MVRAGNRRQVFFRSFSQFLAVFIACKFQSLGSVFFTLSFVLAYFFAVFCNFVFAAFFQFFAFSSVGHHERAIKSTLPSGKPVLGSRSRLLDLQTPLSNSQERNSLSDGQSCLAIPRKLLYRLQTLQASVGKKLEEGKRAPTPSLSDLLRKRPVSLWADFVLSKGPPTACLQDPSLSSLPQKLPFVRLCWVLAKRRNWHFVKWTVFLVGLKVRGGGLPVFKKRPANKEGSNPFI